jgi:hypothetical protein
MNVWLYLVLIVVSIVNYFALGADKHCQPYQSTWQADKSTVTDCWCLEANLTYVNESLPAPYSRMAPPYSPLPEWCLVYRSSASPETGTPFFSDEHTFQWWGTKATISSPWDET